MNLNVYQTRAYGTAKGLASDTLYYPALGLGGETGELVEKIKKIYRDKGGEISEEDREAIKKEGGDVLWYLSCLMKNCGIALEDVALTNLHKTQDRAERGVLGGEGDDR